MSQHIQEPFNIPLIVGFCFNLKVGVMFCLSDLFCWITTSDPTAKMLTEVIPSAVLHIIFSVILMMCVLFRSVVKDRGVRTSPCHMHLKTARGFFLAASESTTPPRWKWHRKTPAQRFATWDTWHRTVPEGRTTGRRRQTGQAVSRSNGFQILFVQTFGFGQEVDFCSINGPWIILNVFTNTL